MHFKNRPSCLGLDINLFFVEDDSGNANYTNLDHIKRMCNSCPALDECFEHARDNLVYGIWAGTTFNERDSYRRKHGIVGKPVVPIGLVRDHLEVLEREHNDIS
jgi:hypothetical protein